MHDRVRAEPQPVRPSLGQRNPAPQSKSAFSSGRQALVNLRAVGKLRYGHRGRIIHGAHDRLVTDTPFRWVSSRKMRAREPIGPGFRRCGGTSADQATRYSVEEVVLIGWRCRISDLPAEPGLEYPQSL